MENPDGLLVSFREQWQKELELISNPPQKGAKKVEENLDNFNSLEDEAKTLFLKGAENERSGNHYEAIQFYKRAVQLVPDIEFRIYNNNKALHISTVDADNEDDSDELVQNEDHLLPSEDLVLLFQKEMATEQNYACLPETPQTGTHISALPLEILLYIFRWVVSPDLDLRSLESCAQVCRSFYLCARGNELWKAACQQIWGLKMQPLPGSKHNCWRRTFTNSPFIKTSGCYISKTSYIRHGENSFQDQSYRPWHLVTYYRYLRFFGGGQVLMLCTPTEPAQSVGQLRHKSSSNNSVLMGHYLISNDIITVVFHQTASTAASSFSNKNKRSKSVPKETSETTFHMAENILDQCLEQPNFDPWENPIACFKTGFTALRMELKNSHCVHHYFREKEFQILNYKSRLSVQLVWRRYSLYQKKSGQEMQSTFDLVNTKFPPFWYSRVKSYTAESEAPLM